jgi:hypothetical protein
VVGTVIEAVIVAVMVAVAAEVSAVVALEFHLLLRVNKYNLHRIILDSVLEMPPDLSIFIKLSLAF